MSHFVFKVKKPSGEIVTSERDAADRYELYRLIHESGDEFVSVQEKKKGGAGLKMNISLDFLKTVKAIDKINFARNLGSMVSAGLPLSRALSVLERQAHNKNLKEIILDVRDGIDKGLTFSDSLAKHPKVFSELFVSMVHAGEQSGTLAESLKVIALQLESAYNLERRVRGALMYPAVIICAMVIVAILMFTFVIPTLMKTFIDLNVQLPFTTQIILGISNVIQNYGLYLLVAVIVFGFIFTRWSKTATGKNINHSLMIKLPILGPLVQEVNTARTARTLSSLLGAGVDFVESVSITSQVIQNVHFRSVLEKAGDAIKNGGLMSKIFADNVKLYPIFLSEMMSVGEETGKIGEMLTGVARYYEDDVDQKTKDMSTIIEPVIMVIIAAGVGFFAVAMITPMYSLVNAI
ncbi:MAG: type II secretion system F family protein [Candidatus Pacebacteria bacterium]|nr:type II secretion system F family protein [Candidatus Paceibacterota bacterium]